jgi:pimeloyl-ACP methyl ester carboxylesterase
VTDAFIFEEFFVSDDHPMYVQRWAPTQVDGLPSSGQAVLIHGGGHTGTCWTTCPDGRPGWARHFVERGWTAFVVDWPGVGRSHRDATFLETGPTPIVEALCTLLRQVGPSVLFGHSLGAPIAAKVIDEVPELVTGLVAISPAPLGNMTSERVEVPPDQPIVVSREAIEAVLANSDRFPQAFVGTYERSLCPLSPAVVHALGNSDGSSSLVVTDLDKLRSLPRIVVVGDQDHLTDPTRTELVAQVLMVDQVVTGPDWGLEGFGHMIPIEVGSEKLLFKLLDWLGSSD